MGSDDKSRNPMRPSPEAARLALERVFVACVPLVDDSGVPIDRAVDECLTLVLRDGVAGPRTVAQVARFAVEATEWKCAQPNGPTGVNIAKYLWSTFRDALGKPEKVPTRKINAVDLEYEARETDRTMREADDRAKAFASSMLTDDERVETIARIGAFLDRRARPDFSGDWQPPRERLRDGPSPGPGEARRLPMAVTPRPRGEIDGEIPTMADAIGEAIDTAKGFDE